MAPLETLQKEDDRLVVFWVPQDGRQVQELRVIKVPRRKREEGSDTFSDGGLCLAGFEAGPLLLNHNLPGLKLFVRRLQDDLRELGICPGNIGHFFENVRFVHGPVGGVPVGVLDLVEEFVVAGGSEVLVPVLQRFNLVLVAGVKRELGRLGRFFFKDFRDIILVDGIRLRLWLSGCGRLEFWERILLDDQLFGTCTLLVRVVVACWDVGILEALDLNSRRLLCFSSSG